ncbi:uncharacterized protein Z518_09033 [Rhinocladiella mackenziei CBS 650.93]|uniref:WW domain-containing protein n=1 Tax=Rhinocladiella mackenziei CBS 650.93 TaxID=1442369 RepID=A0A0D2GSG6_9EURO|nr:uncharacterized protein Z518_09033 [Rhinocladiella mackenziei CBS 650.93]KIX01308.1 hypothetical protein Z518_09033 [Rhinocladiella mackenziei CBS 650.93]
MSAQDHLPAENPWLTFVADFEDAVQNNENAAASHFIAISMALPLATFAYIGVELLTVTAFEARDPHELKLPARNIAWFTVVLYCLTTGLIVSNISWKDQNLPGLFGQALTTLTDAEERNKYMAAFPELKTNAAPIIVTIQYGFKFLPGFLNGCLIYSALSCANTALYVAARQLYGMTRSITVTGQSGPLRRFLAWTSGVEFRTRSPWPALIISVVVLYWLPFIRLHEDTAFLQTFQDVIVNISSVSAVLVWCSQCVAYFMFYHWRSIHLEEIESRRRYESLTDPDKSGWFRILQPGLAYIGAISTFLIVFFFNTASLWNGKKIAVKATSTFISPFMLLLIWALKKFTRPRRQWRFFVDLTDWSEFERRIQRLDELIYPGEGPSVRSREEMQETILTANIDHDPISRPSSTEKQPEAYTRSDLRLATNIADHRRGHSVSPVQNMSRPNSEVEAVAGGRSGDTSGAHSPYARSSLTMRMLQAGAVHEVDGGVVRSTSPPQEWEQRVAPNGRVYYVNHVSQESTWTPPEGFDGQRMDLAINPHTSHTYSS